MIRLRNGTRIGILADLTTVVVGRHDTVVRGAPQRNAEQAATAVALGYGDDVVTMVADHDPLHALLTDWLGMPASVSLFGGDPAVALAEEAAVLAVQKLMRLAGGRMPFPAGKDSR